MKDSLPQTCCKRMIFRVFDLHRCHARYTKKHTLNHSNMLAYDLMLMTKEFNNKYSDSNTIVFMWKKHSFALIKMEREKYNQSLGVEKHFSSEPCLKASNLPTNCSLVLVEFG